MNSAERSLIAARPATVVSREHRRILEAELSLRCAAQADVFDGWSIGAYATALLLSATAALAIICGICGMNGFQQEPPDPALRALTAEMSRPPAALNVFASDPAGGIQSNAPSRVRVTAFAEQRVLLNELLYEL